MEVETSIIEGLRDPQMRHAAFVHLPVALSALGVIPLVALALTAGCNRTARLITAASYALLLVAALVVVETGDDAHDDLGALPDAVHVAVVEHEDMAKRIWIFAAGTLVLALATFAPKTAVRVTCAWVAVGAGLITAGWVAVAAHHGGILVYDHGVGTPAREAGAPAPAPAPAPGGAVYGRAAGADDDPRVAFFLREVRPILGDTCERCHNPIRKARSGDLDLTTAAGLTRGGASGPAVVPGNPDASRLVQAIRGGTAGVEPMPPDDEDRLTPEQIAAIEAWVRDGAVWGVVDSE